MGWFDAQIRERIRNDDDLFADAFAGMANLVSSTRIEEAYEKDKKLTKLAVGEICRYYHIRELELPDQVKSLSDILEYQFHPSGIMRRSVRLEPLWYRDAAGAMLGTLKNGRMVALLPGSLSGYRYLDPGTGASGRITRKNQDQIEPEAICFYQPFPLRKLRAADLIRYTMGLLRGSDYALLAALTAGITLLGLAAPAVSRYLYSTVLASQNVRLLGSAVITLFFINLSVCMITVVQKIVHANIKIRMNIAVESAVMMRILSLPVDFFKQHSSGELSQRVSYINKFCSRVFDAIFSTGLTAAFSLVYVGQIFLFAPALAGPALGVMAAILLLTGISVFSQMQVNEHQMKEAGKEAGIVYSLIRGVAKIKNAGAEKRAFAWWSRQYVKAAKYIYRPPVFLTLRDTLTTAITLIGTVVLYYRAIGAQVSVADYMAFNTAYGLVSGAFVSLSGIAFTIARFKPILNVIAPVLEAEPETSGLRQNVDRLRGGVELSHVSFRYQESMPLILDDLSLKIRPGQYVAIVGKSGCGKSTLMRMLLGFEQPQKGAVYYDGKDMSSLDLKSLRRKVGVVIQNGKLFQGDIYSNIAISAPGLTLEQAWEAAEMAGMAEDIRQMPMGMNTVISEGQGGISGGQRQRILIARAIAQKPRILMLDEATSALDNLTQKIVSDSLNTLKCTRIVIAHRLSTILHCDRIIVLDHGKIVEDGTYEELLKKNGFFAELAARQRVDL